MAKNKKPNKNGNFMRKLKHKKCNETLIKRGVGAFLFLAKTKGQDLNEEGQAIHNEAMVILQKVRDKKLMEHVKQKFQQLKPKAPKEPANDAG